jgi:hypothetical protein
MCFHPDSKEEFDQGREVGMENINQMVTESLQRQLFQTIFQ